MEGGSKCTVAFKRKRKIFGRDKIVGRNKILGGELNTR
jgi:hypothetical protein